ncbi:hypothetical protein M422DRAFT_38950 [Sphaerobolus stellatus SS14]|uniref:Uncharacterized protein n=1 Tax=Sphaerobolus stellatus (strain SS14) TaxID=990650 RepID=A0A0C9U7B9_SPHS4|nr:hypothetical protein M422DRAFT_38950 [Sphaerobolus stellatus SS14]
MRSEVPVIQEAFGPLSGNQVQQSPCLDDPVQMGPSSEVLLQEHGPRPFNLVSSTETTAESNSEDAILPTTSGQGDRGLQEAAPSDNPYQTETTIIGPISVTQLQRYIRHKKIPRTKSEITIPKNTRGIPSS